MDTSEKLFIDGSNDISLFPPLPTRTKIPYDTCYDESMERYSELCVGSVRLHVRTVLDFPKPGVLFKDIGPLIANPRAFRDAILGLVVLLKDVDFDGIAGLESRGFLFGAPLALEMNKRFYMIRKPNKLPGEKVQVEFAKEYGTDTFEMHTGLFAHGTGEKILVIDDLLATGGSAIAACELIRKAGAIPVAAAFVIELVDDDTVVDGQMNGRARLREARIPVYSLFVTGATMDKSPSSADLAPEI